MANDTVRLEMNPEAAINFANQLIEAAKLVQEKDRSGAYMYVHAAEPTRNGDFVAIRIGKEL